MEAVFDARLALREIGRFGEYLENLLIPWPVLHRKSPKSPDFAKLIRFKDWKGPETEIKEYQIKSTGKKHVKEYQQAAETINVAAKSISEDLNSGSKQEKIKYLPATSKKKARPLKTLKSWLLHI